MKSKKVAIALSAIVLTSTVSGTSFSQERKMSLGESLLRAVIAPDTVKGGASNAKPFELHAGFNYGANMDEGVFLTIYPFEETLRSDQKLSEHRRIYIRNADPEKENYKAPTRGLGLRVPESDQGGNSHCGMYVGIGTFTLSDVREERENVYGEEDEMVTVLNGTLTSAKDVRVTYFECEGGAADQRLLQR